MKIGFIDYYLDEAHANGFPEWINKASNGRVHASYAYAAIDSPHPGGLTTDKWCEKYNIERCATIEELINKSDALLVLSPDNPEHHEALSKLALQSGKRTFIDKTFSPDEETAKRMFHLAKKHNTPLYSCSALRFAQEFKMLDKEKIEAISSWGPGNFKVYSAHQLEPIMMLMGGKPESICFSGTKNFLHFTIRFSDGRVATMNQFLKGSPFMMQVCTTTGNEVVELKSDLYKGFIVALVEFFETGVILVEPSETIKIMAVREAGEKAQATPGEWVLVN